MTDLDFHNNFETIQIVVLATGIPAILTTIFRGWLRRGRLWWDDYWAFVCMVANFLQITGALMHINNPLMENRTTRIASYYIMSNSFYIITWASRLSILSSVIRIDPSSYRRKWMYGVGIGFILTVIALFIQEYDQCEHRVDLVWKTEITPQCPLGKGVGITQLLTDIFADSILLWAPISLFHALKDHTLRIRLTAIFSTCVATTIVSLVHAVFLIENRGPIVMLVGVVEAEVSLVVCNLPVVAAFLLRGGKAEDDRDDLSGIPTSIRFATLARKTLTVLGVKSTFADSDTSGGTGLMPLSSDTDAGRVKVTTVRLGTTQVDSLRLSEDGSMKDHSPVESLSGPIMLHKYSNPKLNHSQLDASAGSV